MQRRLASILIMDVVGYSRLMEEDEAQTLEALKKYRSEIVAPAVAQNNGRQVKLMGDGALFEFASVTEAVSCAIAIQTAMAQATLDGGDPKERILFRVGIHLGDVLVEEDDIYGDAVNIAARLEAMAEPGGICLSQQAFDHVGYRMHCPFQDLGEVRVKNVARALHAWGWSPGTSKVPAPRSNSREDSSSDSVPIVLVEEFVHSGDMEAASDLAGELRSELINALSLRTGVRVATPSEGGEPPTYLLGGRCRLSAERCRIHLSLTIAANGESFWSTRIDGHTSDLFSFVDEAVGKISSALRTHINAYAGAVFASRPDDELTLQQLLSKAAFLFYHVDPKSIAISRETMAAAVARAPKNPMALAMNAYAIMQTIPLAIQRLEDIDADAAMSFADQSVYYGSNVDFAFRNRGRIRLWLRRDHLGCRADEKRSLAINPSYRMSIEDLSLCDIFSGRLKEGISQLDALIREAEIDPFHTSYRFSMLGIAYALAGDGDAAVNHAWTAYDQKRFVPIHALAYAIAASHDAALTGSADFRAMISRHGIRVKDADRFPFVSQSDTDRVADMLRRSGLPE